MVMEYIDGGNLRQYLQKEGKKSNLKNKIERLNNIINGLNIIHKTGLVHKDFHTGNILNSNQISYITDLGLSQPANCQKEEGKIFGVLPYIAPEVLRGNSYTKSSDIYSLGIVVYELFANEYPYPEMDGMDLVLKVCDKSEPLRPNINTVSIPQLLKDLIEKC
jgi:serine/threonine protein kinase